MSKSGRMGKNEHCTYCFEFHKRTMGPNWGCNRVVEVPGCEKCDSRHKAQVYSLKARITALELEIGDKNISHGGADVSKLLTKSARDILDQKTKYEHFLSDLMLRLSMELKEVKGGNDSREIKGVNGSREIDGVNGSLQKTATNSTSWQRVSKREVSDKVVISETVEEPRDVGSVYDNSHETDSSALKARIASLEREKKRFYEERDELLAKSASPMLAQQTDYEQLLAEEKRKFNLKLKEVKDDNDRLRKKAAQSPSWQTAVNLRETIEKPKEVTDVSGISPSVLDAIVDCCHTGEVTFSALVPPDEVLKVAHALELGHLKEYCEAELCRRLTVGNVPDMLILSRRYEGKKLEEEAGKLFKENFDELKSKVFTLLEGPDSSTTSVAESSRGASPETFHRMDFD